MLVSETDGRHPRLPRGDVLLHARSLSKSGDFKETHRTLKWIEEADFEAKTIIAG